MLRLDERDSMNAAHTGIAWKAS